MEHKNNGMIFDTQSWAKRNYATARFYEFLYSKCLTGPGEMVNSMKEAAGGYG